MSNPPAGQETATPRTDNATIEVVRKQIPVLGLPTAFKAVPASVCAGIEMELYAANARLAKLEHLAWHVTESACMDFGETECTVDKDDLIKLGGLLPQEHPKS